MIDIHALTSNCVSTAYHNGGARIAPKKASAFRQGHLCKNEERQLQGGRGGSSIILEVLKVSAAPSSAPPLGAFVAPSAAWCIRCALCAPRGGAEEGAAETPGSGAEEGATETPGSGAEEGAVETPGSGAEEGETEAPGCGFIHVSN